MSLAATVGAGRVGERSSVADTLYRKWRPRSFAELAGQEHVATTLQNALASDRVAHAYLFAGPRGTGKTSTGRLLGKALNCRDRQGGEPCNLCDSCSDFLAGRAMDLIELDAASNRGIDEIRSLRDKVAFAPGAGDFKVYLIDEVHMLTEAAFNALLKTLEEPPPHVIFILATTDAHKVPATIASRCQRFDFRRIPLASAVGTLSQICQSEGISCEDTTLEMIARSSTGSLRDAINLLDQLATSYANELTVEAVRGGLGLIGDERSSILARQSVTSDIAGGLALIASVRDDGLDLRQFQRELIEELRNLLLAKSGLKPHEGTTAERFYEMQQAVADVTTRQILVALRAFGEADLRTDPNSTLALDIALAETALGPAVEAVPSNQDTPARREADKTPSTPRQEQSKAKELAEDHLETAGLPVSASSQAAAKTDTTEPQTPAQPPTPTKPVHTEASPSLESARQSMQEIYDRTRAANVRVAALINSVCDIIEVDDANLTLGFRFEAHLTKATAPESLQLLTETVSAVIGRPMTVKCIQDPGIESWRQRDAANRNPLVRAAQEMGARVLSTDTSTDQPEE